MAQCSSHNIRDVEATAGSPVHQSRITLLKHFEILSYVFKKKKKKSPRTVYYASTRLDATLRGPDVKRDVPWSGVGGGSLGRSPGLASLAW